MKSFKAPKASLGSLDAEATGALIAAATDVAIVLDAAGTIRDVAFSSEDLAAELGRGENWIGKAWVETVARDSRPKVEDMVREQRGATSHRWRHVNQVGAAGESVPILYAAWPLRETGRRIVFGRDLRPVSQLQQRLVEVQQSVERGYSQLRQAEMRYRLLFQMSEDAVLIVDGANGKVIEANPAAQQLFAGTSRRLVGRSLLDAFDGESRGALQAMLGALRGTGRAEEIEVRLPGGGSAEIRINGSTFRHENGLVFLLRLSRAGPDGDAILLPRARQDMLRAVDSLPDGLVVTDAEGQVITANAAFLELVQLVTEEQARGERLDRWLGREGVETEVLLSNLRNRGAVRLYATTLRGQLGGQVHVEISAAPVLHGGDQRFGFAVRDVSARLRPAAVRNHSPSPGRSVEELKELIGRVPLKDLVREAADAIERLCIEAALDISGDNRASAAEMLGLSRQSLYVKLHRYGLGDLGADTMERD